MVGLHVSVHLDALDALCQEAGLDRVTRGTVPPEHHGLVGEVVLDNFEGRVDLGAVHNGIGHQVKAGGDLA